MNQPAGEDWRLELGQICCGVDVACGLGSEQQWRVRALEIQKKSILMLHGMNKLEALEKQSKKILAA